MSRVVPLNELDDLLDELTYPVSTTTVRETFDDVVLEYADGRESLDDVLDRVTDERFESRDALATDLFNVLPTEAVGEPGQSEGEG